MSDQYSYNGRTYTVEREKNTQSGSYEYEFQLYVGGTEVVTATRLERNGISFDDVPNWTAALKTFAEGYIDSDESFDAGLGRVVSEYK